MDAQSAFVDATHVSRILGISKWQVYELAKRDGLPVRAVRVGKSLRWPREPWERLARGESLEALAGPGEPNRNANAGE